MKRFIDVHTGEVMAGCGDVVLKSDTDKACLVIAAYDAGKKVGALAHAMLSAKKTDPQERSLGVHDTNKAIDQMIKDMMLLGATLDDIEVCLVTGENIPHQDDDPQYFRKLDSTIELLRNKHIRMRRNSAIDAHDTHITFDVETGNISYEQPDVRKIFSQ